MLVRTRNNGAINGEGSGDAGNGAGDVRGCFFQVVMTAIAAT